MNPMQWDALRLTSVCALAVLFILYQRLKIKGSVPSALKHTLKASCTFIAVLNALLCALTLKTDWAWLIAAGVFAGMCADVLIGVRFIWGGVAFAIGHMLYVAAFAFKAPPTAAGYITFGALALALALYVLFMRRHLPKRLVAPLIVYALLIAAMTACAIGQNNAARVGAALFVASDMVLLYNGVGKGNRVTDYVCLAMYFSGQLLIGMSPML